MHLLNLVNKSTRRLSKHSKCTALSSWSAASAARLGTVLLTVLCAMVPMSVLLRCVPDEQSKIHNQKRYNMMLSG